MAETAALRVGKYEILRRLAVGGMGEIFLARERGMAGFDRLVVVKRLLPDMARRPEITTMFLDEARIVAHLVHPGIAQIYELGQDDGGPFLAMEYVPGEDLAEIARCAARSAVAVPRPLYVHVVAETARALEFAHHARDVAGAPLGVVHRDVSPQNVMVTAQGDVKLMDFGIAKADNRGHRTDVGKVKGKLAYMAPEQLRGEVVDARSDVFALGVMLWELTLQRRLFAGDSELDTYRKVIEGVVPLPREIDPDYPPALEAVVMGALARDRERRTRSAGLLEGQLRGWLADTGARVDRADLAALMATLFPDAVRGAGDVSASVTATTFVWARTATAAVEAEQLPPAPTRVERRTPPSPAIAAPAVRRRTWPIAAVVAAVLVLGGSALVLRLAGGGSGSDEGEVVAESPDPAAPAPVPAEAEVTPLETGSPAPEATVPAADGGTDGGPSRPATPSRRPASGHRRPPVTATAERVVRPVPAVPIPAPAVPAAKAPIAGKLAVSSERFGVVSIDGQRRKQTPFQTELAPGEHEVEVALSEGGGAPHTRARIEAGKKTKCRVVGKALRCSAPQ